VRACAFSKSERQSARSITDHACHDAKQELVELQASPIPNWSITEIGYPAHITFTFTKARTCLSIVTACKSRPITDGG
jgi:hypothetical protein